MGEKGGDPFSMGIYSLRLCRGQDGYHPSVQASDPDVPPGFAADTAQSTWKPWRAIATLLFMLIHQESEIPKAVFS